ncbi:MAG: GNAT family N-acetyltransferase [Flavobacteriales bacterium]|nr:GNAT family N-acetyltransferase [Flavobacteriales bacterium]
MIRHVGHNAIDTALWDAMLSKCVNRMWYMQSWVLDIASPGWEALIDEEVGAIMPLTWRRKWGAHYLFQPYGLQQQGVFAPRVDAALCAAFLAAVPRRFAYWDIYLNESMRIAAGNGDKVSENTQQVLALEGDVATLRAGYSQGHRRNLRKTAAEGSVMTEQVGAQEFVELFRLTTAERFGGGPSGSMEVLERLIAAALERGQCRMLGMRENDSLIAAGCFMEWEGRSIFFKSANNAAGLEQQAMFRITDRYIADHAGSGILLDFAGSNTASVARFNAGFGAHSTVYLRLVRNRLPVPFKWFKT